MACNMILQTRKFSNEFKLAAESQQLRLEQEVRLVVLPRDSLHCFLAARGPRSLTRVFQLDRMLQFLIGRCYSRGLV